MSLHALQYHAQRFENVFERPALIEVLSEVAGSECEPCARVLLCDNIGLCSKQVKRLSGCVARRGRGFV